VVMMEVYAKQAVSCTVVYEKQTAAY